MKSTTQFFLLALCLITVSATLNAGKLKGKVQSAGDNGMISVYLNGNGGAAMSSGVSNALSFNPNVGVEVGWGSFGLGIDASTFTAKPDFDFDAYAAPLRALDFLTVTGSSNNWRSSSFSIGPSYTFSFRSVKPISGIGIVVKHNYPKATLRLSVKGGVTLNQSPDSFSVTNKLTRKQIASHSAPSDFQKNAFTIKPSISFNYWLSQRIALSANVQYAIQTGQSAFTTGYKDLSKVTISPTMSPDQFNKNITSAPNVTTTTVGPDKYLSAGVGITYTFGRKGWDGSVKGKHAISTKGTGGTKLRSGVIAEVGSAVPNQLSDKGITENGITENEVQRKGIRENGLKKNEAELVLADAELKAIAETLVNMRKGWDGTVKGGNIAENRGIEKKGIKKNEAKSENSDLNTTKAIAETLLNVARKGWDGTVKGGSIDVDADIVAVTETLETIRKGWDGSVKGKISEYVASDADVKAIAETLVNLRKGWDGSVKGNKKAITQSGIKRTESARKGWDGSVKGSNVSIPVNGDVIHVQTTPEGCIVLFSDNGFAVNSDKKTITVLSKAAHTSFGEKVNAGMQSAGGAIAQGASLLGGALPGGNVISAVISSVSSSVTDAGADANAKIADKKKKKVWASGLDDDCDGLANIPDGDYEIEVIIENSSSTKSANAAQTIFSIEFSSVSNVLKTKHDTAKNSINNVR